MDFDIPTSGFDLSGWDVQPNGGDMMFSDLNYAQPLPYSFGDNGQSISGGDFYQGSQFGDVSVDPMRYSLTQGGFTSVADPYGFQELMTTPKPNDPSWLSKVLKALSAVGKGAGGSGGGAAAGGGARRQGEQSAGGPSSININDSRSPGTSKFLSPAEYGAAGAANFSKFIEYMNKVAPMLFQNGYPVPQQAARGRSTGQFYGA